MSETQQAEAVAAGCSNSVRAAGSGASMEVESPATGGAGPSAGPSVGSGGAEMTEDEESELLTKLREFIEQQGAFCLKLSTQKRARQDAPAGPTLVLR